MSNHCSVESLQCTDEHARCQATLLPSDAFGREAPEGSEAFRFQTIAAKPSFIRDEMDATKLPVAFLDTDLEFHSFPKLFVPGSWPGGGRDVAAFNYWGNETDWEHASTPTTGSGVIFFNQTSRARGVLTAWAEAMAWDTNTRAPDDQVRGSTGYEFAYYSHTVPGDDYNSCVHCGLPKVALSFNGARRLRPRPYLL